MKTQIIFTGVSGSGKTTLMEKLLDEYPNTFGRPIQYTTRKPRDDKELDIYVFLTKDQFMSKLSNGDFAEFTEYNGNLYAISSIINTSISNIFIVEPVGRSALKKYFDINEIPHKSYYLEISEEETMKRLVGRGASVKEIELRLKDFKYFYPELTDKVLDATLPIDRNILHIAKSNGAL